MRRAFSFAWGLALFQSLAAPAHAAGYYSGAKSARAAGRSGAFVARADDISAVVTNPAGIARLDGTVAQIGNRFSRNEHSYTRQPTPDWGDPPGLETPRVVFWPVENETPWQTFEPFVGVSTNLGLADWGFALSAYSPAGVSEQRFPIGGGQRYMMVSRETVAIHYNATAAWKLADVFAAGVTLQWISVPKLSYSLVIDADPLAGAANPVSSELDMLATVSGSDVFTFNAILGAWYRPAPFLELGASAQVIPSELRARSRLRVTPLSSGIDQGIELEREGAPANDVSLRLPLPMTARAGARYRHLSGGRELFDIEVDVALETWSRVDRFTMHGDGLQAIFLGQRVDVSRINIEKQWRDTVTVQVGGDYAVLPGTCVVRVGASYESAVSEPEYAHVDFVSGEQLGGSLGASVFAAGFEVALAYEYRHQPTRKIDEQHSRVYQQRPASACAPPFTDPVACHEQYRGRPGPPVNAGQFRAHSHAASVDVLYRF